MGLVARVSDRARLAWKAMSCKQCDALGGARIAVFQHNHGEAALQEVVQRTADAGTAVPRIWLKAHSADGENAVVNDPYAASEVANAEKNNGDEVSWFIE